MSRLTVKSHRPVQWSISIVVLSTVLAVITWLILDRSHWSVIFEHRKINEDFQRISQYNKELEKENSKLKEDILKKEHDAGLDKETASLLQQEIQSLQDEIYQLKGELEFYQGVMNATGESTGLNIQGIHIQSLVQQHSFRLKLVLTHVTKSTKVATGSVKVTIEGIQNGKSTHLDLQDVSLDNMLDLSFNFRNFKRIECDLELPDDFSPRRVLVLLQPKGGKQSNIIRRVFDWPELAS